MISWRTVSMFMFSACSLGGFQLVDITSLILNRVTRVQKLRALFESHRTHAFLYPSRTTCGTKCCVDFWELF